MAAGKVRQSGLAVTVILVVLVAVIAGGASTVAVADATKPGDLLFPLDGGADTIPVCDGTTVWREGAWGGVG